MNRRKREYNESESEYLARESFVHCFDKHWSFGLTCRSCGVVRPIMSPSRGDDPGSNPGTSTKIPHY